MSGNKLALSVAVVVGMACTGPKPGPPGGVGDAGGDRPSTATDIADCNCRLEGQGAGATLTMSWDCFCERFGCEGRLQNDCRDHQQRIDYPVCGLTVIQAVPAGGPIGSVYDSGGHMVGGFRASDTSPYVCPSDPTIEALTVRAGTFPAATCAEKDCGMCSNLDPSCVGHDAGITRDGGGTSPDLGDCQCRLEGTNQSNNVLWMSLPCFCAAYRCDNYETMCHADPSNRMWDRFDHPACGLTVLRWTNTIFGFAWERVFDASRNVVGGMVTGDTFFSCPSNPSLAAAQVRAGQFPSPECQGKSCGSCRTPDPSCGAADGSSD